MDVDTFMQNVKLYCSANGIAPTVAGRESGAGKDMMTNLKKGQIPSVEKVQKLAIYLGCTVSDLLGEKKESTPISEGELHDPLEAQLMDLVRQLSPDSKKMLIAQLEVLLRNQSP